MAGHDTIMATIRYLHARQETVRKLFVRLGGLECPPEESECTGAGAESGAADVALRGISMQLVDRRFT